MFEIPFTQYLLPDGRTRPMTYECRTEDQETQAKVLLEYGARFEVEILQTGEVSLTVEKEDDEGEDETLAHEICPNDENITHAVERLVQTAHSRIPHEPQ